LTFSCKMSAACLTEPVPGKKQTTLSKPISFSGFGIFTGEKVTMRLLPAEAGHGVVFKRTDLPFQPIIPAKMSFVKPSSRCTMLVNREASVQTVEHLLAALRAYEVDNVLIEISGPEVPILDGSAAPFADSLEGSVTTINDNLKSYYQVKTPLFWSKQDVHLVALPSDEYRISYTLHYPHSKFVGSQFYSFVVDKDLFTHEIAPSRTFALYEEMAPLIEKGMIKGGLENGVVINENGVMNPEGLRFPDEFVRHKILDLLGDLSLIGLNFNAHIIAIRSGHASNHAFGLELLNHFKMECS
jgi:UDP-3-O-[3-hydroxymyristoyl] N-acetylglucosamine deacetylase